MKPWHGYIAVTRPALVLGSAWRQQLRQYEVVLGKDDTNSQPAKRLHWRRSPNGDEAIFEGVFDLDTLRADAVVGSLTIFAEGKEWEASRQQAAAYINQRPAFWGE